MAEAAHSLGERYPVALVTGASSGIGKAIAGALLVEGITVYGTSRDPGKGGLDSRIRWLRFDGSSTPGIRQFIEGHEQLLNKIHLLINNAGASRFGEVSRLSEEEIRRQICLLVEAPIQLSRAVLPSLRKKGGGIVNVSSLASRFPLPYMPVYTAGKGGLSGFTQSLLLTERSSGVTVWDFQPGDFCTAFNRNQAALHRLTDAEQKAWERVEYHLEQSPRPEKAAQDLLRALRRGRGGVVVTGGLFQKHIAPLAERLMPRAMLLGIVRQYYKLGS